MPVTLKKNRPSVTPKTMHPDVVGAYNMPEEPNVGKATHFTTHEGGTWIEFDIYTARQPLCIFAVRFETGWVWDPIHSWKDPQ